MLLPIHNLDDATDEEIAALVSRIFRRPRGSFGYMLLMVPLEDVPGQRPVVRIMADTNSMDQIRMVLQKVAAQLG
jgi:hypothetical protein